MFVGVTWFVSGLRELSADAYVVVDVLRFSTTVTVALDSGFNRIHVFADLGKAVEFSRRVKAPLAAEVEGVKPAEADLDNSPTDVLEWVGRHGVGGGELVIRTTSGALVVDEAARLGLRNVFVCSLLNARAVAKAIVDLGVSSVNVVCAGHRRSRFSIEDFLGAGALVYRLADLSGGLRLDDGALAALHLLESVVSRGELLRVVRSGHHGSFLWSTGRGRDVELACRLDSLSVVPEVVGNVIRRHRNDPSG